MLETLLSINLKNTCVKESVNMTVILVWNKFFYSQQKYLKMEAHQIIPTTGQRMKSFVNLQVKGYINKYISIYHD